MKQIFKNLTYTLLATSLLCACSSESDPVTATSETNPDAISFTSYVGDMTRQSAETPAALQDLQQNGFKVFANRTTTDWATDGASSAADFMYDQTVAYSTEFNAWSYSPAKVWPKTDKVSFFAYSPYNSQASTFMASPYNVSGATKLEYTHNGRIGSQDDLLAAASLDYNKAKQNGSVGFNFYHTLSKLRFAYSREAIAQTTTVEVSKMELQYVDGTIQNKRVLNLAGVGASMTADIWSSPATETNYTGDACQAGSVLNGEHVLLIPQTYEDGELELVVSYKLTTNDPALPAPIVDEVVDRAIALPAIEGGLQPNKQYLYTLDIKPNAIKISSDIAVGAWGEASSQLVKQEDKTVGISYENNTFHITNARGLAVYRDIVNRKNQVEVSGYDGIPNDHRANGQLDSDIDLSTVCGPDAALGTWTPIGDYSGYFSGQFDGQGHYIENLYVSKEDKEYRGLFGAVRFGASLSNVKVRGAYVYGSLRLGAICGHIFQSTMTNCHVLADSTHPVTITGKYHYMGALAGIAGSSTITGCTVRVDGGSMTINAPYDQVGALVGRAESSTIKNSTVFVTNNGSLDVKANAHYAGGLAGCIVGDSKVINCSISSSDLSTSPIHITAKNYYAGGLVGQIASATVVGSYSAVSDVVSLSNAAYAGYGFGHATSVTVYSSWAYCATQPSTNNFIGAGYSTTIDSSVFWGTSSISYTENMVNLHNGINTYNNSVTEDALKAVHFNAQGTYGPIVSTTPIIKDPIFF